MQVVEEFGAVSGLRVGWEKLQALAIGPPSPYDYLQRSCIQLTPSLKYLGIQIHADLPRYEELNVTPIVQQMTEKFRTWSSLPLNLIGHINIFKMIFLPKFLYSFRASPVFLTKKLFAKLDSALFTFIWNDCQPRIAKSSLQAAKPIGGLACPNLRNYFLASQLTYIHDWLHSDPQTPSTAFLLSLFASPTSLRDELHRSRKTGGSRFSPIEVCFMAWREGVKILTQSQVDILPRAPLWQNLNFHELCGHPDSTWLARFGITHLSYF